MLQLDPAQKPRLMAVEANTIERLDEAGSMKWLGEVHALEESLRHIRRKRAQADQDEGQSTFEGSRL
jgi:hypothetical protein